MTQPSPAHATPPTPDPRLKAALRESIQTRTPPSADAVEALHEFVRLKASTTVAPARGAAISFLYLDDDPENGFIVFVQALAPGGGFIAEHYHVEQEEIFIILEGTASYRLDGAYHTAGPHETVIVPGSAHHVNPWNEGLEGDVVLLRIVAPSLDTQKFYDNWYGLVRDGRHLNKKTLEPNLVQAGMMQYAYTSRTYFTSMPAWFQRIGAFFSYYLGRLIGYKADYPEYARAIQGPDAIVHATPSVRPAARRARRAPQSAAGHGAAPAA